MANLLVWVGIHTDLVAIMVSQNDSPASSPQDLFLSLQASPIGTHDPINMHHSQQHHYSKFPHLLQIKINFSDKQLKISAAFPTIYFSYSKWKNIVEITVTVL